MAFRDDQLVEIQYGRRQVEAVLAGEPDALRDFERDVALPKQLADAIGSRLRSPDSQTRAIALLKALDWISVNQLLRAIGIAFALQAKWRKRMQDDDFTAKDLALVRANTALILQSLSFALIAAGGYTEAWALADDMIPGLLEIGLPLSAAALQVTSAEAFWHRGQPSKARERLPDRASILRAAEQQADAAADAIIGGTLVRWDNLAHDLSNLESATVAEQQTFEQRNGRMTDEMLESVRGVLKRVGKADTEIGLAETTLRDAAMGIRGTGAVKLLGIAHLMQMLEDTLGPLVPGLKPTAIIYRRAALAKCG